MAKSISIPPNRSALRGQRLAAAADVATRSAPPALRPEPLRALAPQPQHRFAVGEHLRLQRGGSTVSRQEGTCRVTALLPYEGRGALQYRVQSEREQFERVVVEADLSRNS